MLRCDEMGGTTVTKLAATRGQRVTRLSAAVVLVGAILAGGASPAAAAGPNIVSQWDKIAEDTVVGSGAQQIESLIYLSYTQAAVYDAVVAIEGGYEPYGPPLTGPAGASTEAAVVEAAYTTLSTYFPASAAALLTARNLSLSAIADGTAKTDGLAVGYLAARNIVTLREGDGRLTPIATTSPFPTKTPAPGVWRLTPPAYAAPQIPWAGSVKPFVLKRPDQFRPAAPPSLTSWTWVDGLQGDQEDGRRDQHRPDGRADRGRAVLHRQRAPPVEPTRARHRRSEVVERPPDGTPRGDDQHGRRRCRHRGHERQVPLPVLAARHGDRPGLGQAHG